MVKINNIVPKADWVKLIILITIASGLWIWVYTEYKKPIIPPDWDKGPNTEGLTLQKD